MVGPLSYQQCHPSWYQNHGAKFTMAGPRHAQIAIVHRQAVCKTRNERLSGPLARSRKHLLRVMQSSLSAISYSEAPLFVES